MRKNLFLRARPRRACTDTPAGANRPWAAVAAPLVGVVLAILLSACATGVHQSTADATFATRHGDFTYAEVEVVAQSEPRSCGLAVLACVLRYWEKPVTEAELLKRHPIGSGLGHSLQTLQAIAQEQGVLAFALSLKPGPAGSPSVQLSNHLSKGRPVIVAVRLPQGRYFGEPIPVLGTLDARTVRPFGLVPSATGQEFKHHYVVVFGEDPTHYLLMDPAYGIVSVPRPSLLQWWSDVGYAALLCSPAPASPTSLSPLSPPSL